MGGRRKPSPHGNIHQELSFSPNSWEKGGENCHLVLPCSEAFKSGQKEGVFVAAPD